MITRILFGIYFLLAASLSQAQINLVGASTAGSSGIQILKWQALDPSSVETYQTQLEGYVMGSSGYDALNGDYYLSGYAANNFGLFSFNTINNTQSINPLSAFSSITEFDMSTGKIYTLSADSTDYIVVNQYDITSGADSILGAIYEPGIMGIIADATGFNSNQGILYYVGIDGSNALNLFSIDVRSTVFSYTKTLVITPNFGNNIQSVNYDNVHDKLFAMNSVYDSSFTFQGSYVVEIDLLTGIIQNRGLLEGFVGFVVGSSSFDQNSSSLLLIGLTANNNMQMIVFNTLTNTYITGFVPSGVSEVVCDNTNFASNAYVTKITTPDKTASLQLYPNPAVHQLAIQLPEGTPLNQSARIFDLNGRAILEVQLVERTTKVDISNLKPGNYFLKYHAETLRFTKL